MNEELASEIICEILEEVTVVPCSFGNLYLKHFSSLESTKVLNKKESFINEAVRRGIEKEEDALKRIIKDGLWSDEEENKIQTGRTYIARMKEGLSKIKIPSQRDVQLEHIKEQEENIKKSESKRWAFIGLSAEMYADKQLNKLFFASIGFADKEMTKPIMETLDYEQISAERDIMIAQKDFFEKFSGENISKAALSTYFNPFLSYTESSLEVFGKPLKDLTVFQMRLISYGRTFLNIFKNARKKIPEYVLKDPELLIQFHEAQQNEGSQTKGAGSHGTGASTFIGANSSDMEQLKESDEDVINLGDAVKEKGGSIGMKEMMELHGL